MEYQTRKINDNDLENLLELYKHLHPDDANTAEDSLKKSWKQIITNDNFFRYFVIEYNSAIIASCCISIIPNATRRGRPYALIENVITHPEHRRKGLGTLVMKEAIDYAQKQRCYKIMLLSDFKRIEAHAFYNSLGFDENSKKGFIIKL